MRAGDLREQITLLAPSRTTDSFGAQTPTFDVAACRWASVLPVSAREQIQSSRVQLQTTYTVRLRYYAALQSDWRVGWGNRTLVIDSVIRRPREGAMELIAHEVTAGA
jgi:SPP1 family predicted phage head-tail adaptor